MMTRFVLLLVTVALVAVPQVLAESTLCGYPVLIIPDGRITHSTFGQNTSYWYGVYAQAGHSYAVEFEPPADNYLNTTTVQFSPIGVFGSYDLSVCRGSSSVAVTPNSGSAPAILKNGNGAGRRVSFTAQGAGLYLIYVTNIAGSGNYSFSAVDTTLFNMRWSTWAGYGDQWGFLNLSDTAITGLLTVYDTNNKVIASVQFTIPAGGEVVRQSYWNDLNLPPNSNGFAMFSHNGPPNAIIADAYMVSPTGLVVTYTKFESVGTR
jgi:hypothetical protein